MTQRHTCSARECRRKPRRGGRWCDLHHPRFDWDGEAESRPVEHHELVTIEEVSKHRQINCSRYEACLDIAAGQDWRGWSCRACPVGAMDPMERVGIPVGESALAMEIKQPQARVRDYEPTVITQVPNRTIILEMLELQPLTKEELIAGGLRDIGLDECLLHLQDSGDIRLRVGMRWEVTGERMCSKCGDLKPLFLFPFSPVSGVRSRRCVRCTRSRAA